MNWHWPTAIECVAFPGVREGWRLRERWTQISQELTVHLNVGHRVLPSVQATLSHYVCLCFQHSWPLGVAAPWGSDSSTEPGMEVSGTQFCLGDLHTMEECAISITEGPPHNITGVVQSLGTPNPRLNQFFMSKINFEKMIIEESHVFKRIFISS